MPKRLEYDIINVYFTIHTLSHIPNLKKHLPEKRKRFLFQITLFALSLDKINWNQL